MSNINNIYHDLCEKIIKTGYKYEDPNRKDIYRYEIPHYTISHSVEHGFPAINTKKLAWKSVVTELLWILRGDNNIKYLIDNNVNIWNKDAYNYYLKACEYCDLPKLTIEEFIKKVGESTTFSEYPRYGDIGKAYGSQLRDWSRTEESLRRVGFDQLAWLINEMKSNPMGTKKTVTFWNPAEKDQCALTPCHWSFEILVEPIPLESSISDSVDEMLDFSTVPPISNGIIDATQKYQFTLKWHQHSVDTFLGSPFNIASYNLLGLILSEITSLPLKCIIGDLSNVHIYEPHLDKVEEQLSRDPNKYGNCELEFHPEFKIACNAYNTGVLTLDEFISELRPDMFKLKDYKSYPAIHAEMLPYNK